MQGESFSASHNPTRSDPPEFQEPPREQLQTREQWFPKKLQAVVECVKEKVRAEKCKQACPWTHAGHHHGTDSQTWHETLVEPNPSEYHIWCQYAWMLLFTYTFPYPGDRRLLYMWTTTYNGSSMLFSKVFTPFVNNAEVNIFIVRSSHISLT